MDYYVYAYLREDNSPYYIGMGRRYRMDTPHISQNISLPPKDRRVKLHQNLTEAEALSIEKQLISEYGRKIDGGQLLNLALQGSGNSRTPEMIRKGVETRIKNDSYKHSAATREMMSASQKKAWETRELTEEAREKMRENGRKTKKRYTDGLTPQQRYVLRKKGLYQE